MKTKRDFCQAIVVLVSLFFILLAGHFGSTVGVVVFSLPLFYVIYRRYINDTKTVKSTNSIVKNMLIIRAIANGGAVVCAVVYIIILLTSKNYFIIANFPVVFLVICISNLLIEMYLKNVIKKELKAKGEDIYYKEL